MPGRLMSKEMLACVTQRPRRHEGSDRFGVKLTGIHCRCFKPKYQAGDTADLWWPTGRSLRRWPCLKACIARILMVLDEDLYPVTWKPTPYPQKL